MSTKIYNVHKFSGTMPELMDHLQKYRILWLDYMKLKITNYVSMYPKAALLDMKSEYICLTNLIDIIRKQTNSKYKQGELKSIGENIVDSKTSIYRVVYLLNGGEY